MTTAEKIKALEADALDFAQLAQRRFFGGDYEGAKQALAASKEACLLRLELLNNAR